MSQNLLINACKAIFEDGRFYLSKISKDIYTQPLELFSGSSLGQHTRHWIEFFQCLMDQSLNEGGLCYDKRKRDLSLETQPGRALDVLGEIERSLERITELNTLVLTSEMSDGTIVKMPTSLDRELWFVVEHAVHHLAFIKIGLKEQYPDWILPEHFGVANSTIRYQAGSAAK